MDATNTTAIEEAITAPSSAAVDGQSASLQSASDQIDRVVFAEGRGALGGTNARGGKRSGWSCCRIAKWVPPGGAQ